MGFAPYNSIHTDDPQAIEHWVEDRITEHSEDVQLRQSVLDERNDHRAGAERTNDAVTDYGLDTSALETAFTNEHK